MLKSNLNQELDAMADPKHVERLKHSIQEWNSWRLEHPSNSRSSNIRDGLSYTGASHGPTAHSVSCFINQNRNLIAADLLWREFDRYIDLIRPNLSGANLSGIDLSGADLHYTDLSGADLSNTNLSNTNLSDTSLSGANLSGVTLDGANLSGTNFGLTFLYGINFSLLDLSGANFSFASLGGARLSAANLSGTNLSNTDLSNTDLSGADLSGADLSYANLSRVNISRACFNQAKFVHTLFAWVDLSQVRDLETATHEGPSSVDINSVTLPFDEPTRLHFLRGVGFTETQIEYLPSLLTPRPIEYCSLFISYAHQDETFAKRLYIDLRKKDVPCWFAPHDLRPGTPILRGIEEAIRVQEKFLLILSKHAVESKWIKQELDAVLYQEIKHKKEVLFPIRLDDTILESSDDWTIQLQRRHIGDFTSWQNDIAYQQAFTTLLQHLKVTQPPTDRGASS